MVTLNVLKLTAKVVIAIILIVASTFPRALAETYRWTDANGNVGFADSLQKVPPQYRESARRVDGKSSASPHSKTFQTVPSAPTESAGPPPGDSEQIYAVWRDRINSARGELEQLKAQREAARKEYDTQRAEFYARSFSDPEVDAKQRARLTELDEQISERERALSTTIPDEARKAGIPPGVLSQ